MIKQYKDARKDARYMKPQMSDAAFFSLLSLEGDALGDVRAAAACADYDTAFEAFRAYCLRTSASRNYAGTAELHEIGAHIKKNRAPEKYAGILQEADRICEGFVPFDTKAGSAKDWKEIALGNPPYPWNGWFFDTSQYQLRLVRFDWMVALSRAYCITGEKRYAAKAAALLSDFIRECPVPNSGMFCVEHCTWEPLSTGVRMFHLPEIVLACLGEECFSGAVFADIVKLIYEHGLYLRQHHATLGNHACMELRGLAITAIMLPEIKESAEWLHYALTEFVRQVQDNVYSDGVQFEASPGYHTVVMRDIYELTALLDRQAIPYAPYLKETLEKMMVFVQQIQTPGGYLPRFGDTSSNPGHTMKREMAIGTQNFSRADFKFFAEEKAPIDLLWRYGLAFEQAYEAIPSQPPCAISAVFPVSGYITMRSGWDADALYLACRAGVGGNGHAHSDALSILINAYGKELLVDAGVGIYEWNRERKYFLSTRAHNTIAVDGQDQNVRNFHWEPLRTAFCKIWDFISTDTYVFFSASHYGYTRLEDPVIHTRKVLYMKKGYYLVLDVIKAKEAHDYELLFHLPPNEVIADPTLTAIRAEEGGVGVLIQSLPNTASKACIETGLVYMRHETLKAPVLSYTQKNHTGNACFVTLVAPYSAASGGMPRVKMERIEAEMDGGPADECILTALKVSFNGTQDTLIINNSMDESVLLDHTGNLVGAELVSAVQSQASFKCQGVTYQKDFVVLEG